MRHTSHTVYNHAAVAAATKEQLNCCFVVVAFIAIDTSKDTFFYFPAFINNKQQKSRFTALHYYPFNFFNTNIYQIICNPINTYAIFFLFRNKGGCACAVLCINRLCSMIIRYFLRVDSILENGCCSCFWPVFFSLSFLFLFSLLLLIHLSHLTISLSPSCLISNRFRHHSKI